MQNESLAHRAPLRARLAVMLVATLAVGIATRRVHLGLVLWDKSAGDALYAVAVYLAIALAFPRWRRRFVAISAFAACFAIELFQLTGIPLELARTHAFTHWVLGSSFAWHDVGCYAVGVLLAAAMAPPNRARHQGVHD